MNIEAKHLSLYTKIKVERKIKINKITTILFRHKGFILKVYEPCPLRYALQMNLLQAHPLVKSLYEHC